MDQLRHILPFIVRYRVRLLLGFCCAIGSAAMTASIPQIVRLVVNDLDTQGVIATQLLRYGALLALVGLLDACFRFGQRLLVAGTSYLIEYDIRAALFRRLLLLDQGFYGRMYTGDLMARVTNDLSAVRQLLGPGLNSVVGSSLLLTAAAVLMFLTNVTLALLVMLLLPIVTVLFIVVGARMRRIFRTVQDQFGNLSTRAQENFSGIRTIKAYAQEDAEIREFRDANERYRVLNVRYVLLSGLLWPTIMMVLGMTGAVVLLVGGRFVAAGTMTLGDLALFNGYLALLSWPMIALGWTVNLYQQASASMGRIAEVLHRRPDISTPTDAVEQLTLAGDIEFRNVGVRFSYDEIEQHNHQNKPTGRQVKENGSASVSSDRRVSRLHEEWVLRRVSFTIPHGTSLAIVGATGAGKTTLVNLLARVRDPDEGQVLIDGQDIRTLPLDQLRRSIGYIPQDTFLFSLPLRENVTFGRTDATEDEITQALAVSRLSNDLPQFPNGMDTLIGERGVTLSGGQKQRAAIARAVLRDPAILVLDDALSSVDTHTAAEILAALRKVMQERTSIIIAQRIATVKDADQIIVLHNGEIVEQGSHRELLEYGERYAAMYRRELLRAELESD